MGEWRKAIIQNINHIILMETSKARIPYLDFLKFFAIGSVLLGHSVEQLTGNDLLVTKDKGCARYGT